MTNDNAQWPFPMNKPAQMTTTNYAKERAATERELLLSDARRNGVNVVHIFNEEYPKGGLTVAFRKTMPGQKSTNMVDCAFAVCSFLDSFNRKIGTEQALAKWFDGDIVQLPLSAGYAEEDLNGRVKQAFTAMWKSLT